MSILRIKGTNVYLGIIDKTVGEQTYMNYPFDLLTPKKLIAIKHFLINVLVHITCLYLIMIIVIFKCYFSGENIALP